MGPPGRRLERAHRPTYTAHTHTDTRYEETERILEKGNITGRVVVATRAAEANATPGRKSLRGPFERSQARPGQLVDPPLPRPGAQVGPGRLVDPYSPRR